jgi:hypothetical protein
MTAALLLLPYTDTPQPQPHLLLYVDAAAALAAALGGLLDVVGKDLGVLQDGGEVAPG